MSNSFYSNSNQIPNSTNTSTLPTTTTTTSTSTTTPILNTSSSSSSSLRRSNRSSLMRNDNNLGSQTIPEADEALTSSISFDQLSITSTTAHHHTLLDFQFDPLLGPPRSSSSSSSSSLCHRADQDHHHNNSTTTSILFKSKSNILSPTSQIFYSSSSSTPPPPLPLATSSSKETHSSSPKSKTTPSSSNIPTPIESILHSQQQQHSSITPSSYLLNNRSNSTPTISTSLPSLHSHHEPITVPNQDSLSNNLNHPFRPRSESLAPSSSLWSSTGPLDYTPAHDHSIDRDRWQKNPFQPSNSSPAIAGIPRSLSLQEIPSIPWGLDRNSIHHSNTSAQSLYSEPLINRQLSNQLTSPKCLAGTGIPNYGLNNPINHHLYSNPIFTSTHPKVLNKSSNEDEISTIFVVGFPEDMDEREFQNMFIFCPGFEAASLKIPATTLAARGVLDQSSSSIFGLAQSCTDSGGLIDQFSSIPLGYENFEEIYGTPGSGLHIGIKKQIIGFAKFKSRIDAFNAKEVLSGRKVDAEKGSILKAEMAKKNLHTKRGLSSIEANHNNFNHHPQNNGLFRNANLMGLGSELGFGNHNTFNNHSGFISQQQQPRAINEPHSMVDLTGYHHHVELNQNTNIPSVSASRPRSTTNLFDPFLTNNNSLNLICGPSIIDPQPLVTPPPPRAPIDFNAFIATPNPHHFPSTSLYSNPHWNSIGNEPIETNNDAPKRQESSNTKPHPTHSSSTNNNTTAPVFFPQSSCSGSSSDSSSTSSLQSIISSPGGIGTTQQPNNNNTIKSTIARNHYPADQNPAINTLYVGGLPTILNNQNNQELEERLKKLFEPIEGFKKFSFRSKSGQPMCFVEFINVQKAKFVMENLYGNKLGGLVPGGIRLAFSRNALGVRSNPNPNQPPPPTPLITNPNNLFGSGLLSIHSNPSSSSKVFNNQQHQQPISTVLN